MKSKVYLVIFLPIFILMNFACAAQNMAVTVDNTSKQQSVEANLKKMSVQAKKQALNALDVQVIAAPERVKIRVAVPLDFITIERTSGYQLRHAKNRRCRVGAMAV